ncbi:MAG TPA: hypothetical protein VE964_02845, partial [Myxococcales bacterium]|nr:hypothetical protein [Myxococcales bacterium]
MPAFKTVLLLVLLPAVASLHAQEAAGPQSAAAPPAEATPPAATPPAAYGDAELASYFAAGTLKKAADALQAGQPAQALKLLPKHPDELPGQWLRAFALRAADR